MGTKRTDEFRADAVRIALTSGLTRKQVASGLGVGYAMSSGHVHTFRNASLVLLRDYKSYANYAENKIMHGSFNTGEEFVEIINSQPSDSIVSLDVVCHGNQGGLHIAYELEPPEEAPWDRRRAHYYMRNLEGKNPVTWEDAEYMEEYMAGVYSNRDMMELVSYYFNQKFEKLDIYGASIGTLDGIALLREVSSNKFDQNAFIEFHGCNTAENTPYFHRIRDNFAENFSEHIGRNSVVVGHVENSNPNHPSGGEDYRHGLVRVYRRGALWSTSEGSSETRQNLTFENSSTPPSP